MSSTSRSLENRCPWRVLLLGGSAGAGKSTAAAAIARDCGISWLSADAIWMTLKTATTPESHPSFHHFEPAPEDILQGSQRLFELHVESASAISAALAPFVARQLGEQATLVLEGAWITPAFAYSQVELHKGDVRAIFIHEPDAAEVLATLIARSATTDITERRRVIAEMVWRFGNWLLDEARAHDLPVVEARPRDTLVERILSVTGPPAP